MKSISKKLEAHHQAQQELAEKLLPTIGDSLVVGESFLEDFKKLSSYFLLFGNRIKNIHQKDVPLIGLLPVENPGYNYYSTGTNENDESFVSVWMIEDFRKTYVEYSFEQTRFANMYEHFVNNNPIVLYFMGRDDGSYAKRFENKEAALAYIKTIGSFDNFIEDNIGNALFSQYQKQKEEMNEEEVWEIFESSIVFWN